MKKPFCNNPKTLTLSSMIIGYLLIGNLTAYEQNALGNFFMTIGQILEANSAFQQEIQEDMGTINQTYKYNLNQENIEDIKKLINFLEEKLNAIKKEL